MEFILENLEEVKLSSVSAALRGVESAQSGCRSVCLCDLSHCQRVCPCTRAHVCCGCCDEIDSLATQRTTPHLAALSFLVWFLLPQSFQELRREPELLMEIIMRPVGDLRGPSSGGATGAGAVGSTGGGSGGAGGGGR